MNHRRVIGFLLALALLAGQTFVPLAKAACAMPNPRSAACPSCVGGSSSTEAALTTDRSCCAAPSSLSEREPATVAPDRVGEHRVLGAAVLAAATRVLIAATPPRALSGVCGFPGISPPLLRTTILLI